MRKWVRLVLTEQEVREVRALISVVLTHADQWDMVDLAALKRVADKIDGGGGQG